MRKRLFYSAKDVFGDGWFPQSQKSEEEREQHCHLGPWPEVGVRLASKWIHVSRRDSNVHCFWNARVRKRTTIAVQDFKSVGPRSALDFHLDAFGGRFGFLVAG